MKLCVKRRTKSWSWISFRKLHCVFSVTSQGKPKDEPNDIEADVSSGIKTKTLNWTWEGLYNDHSYIVYCYPVIRTSLSINAAETMHSQPHNSCKRRGKYYLGGGMRRVHERFFLKKKKDEKEKWSQNTIPWPIFFVGSFTHPPLPPTLLFNFPHHPLGSPSLAFRILLRE